MKTKKLTAMVMTAFAISWTSLAHAIPSVPVQQWTNLAPGGITGKPGMGAEGWTTVFYSAAIHGLVMFGKYNGVASPSWGEDPNALLAYRLDTNSWELFAPAEQCGSQDLAGDGHDEGNVGFDPIHQIYISKGNLTLGCVTEGTYEYDLCARAGRHIIPAGQPGGREEKASSFDVDHDALICFGGQATFDEIWIYRHSTATWTQGHPPVSPPGRRSHGQIYDAAHHKTVVFGGNDGTSDLNDTWAYDLDADTWTPIPSAIQPPATSYPPMAFDSVRKVTLLAGAQSFILDLDKGGWQPAPEANLPPDVAAGGGFSAQRLAYDADDRLFLLSPSAWLSVWAFRFDEATTPPDGTVGKALCLAAPPPIATGVGGSGAGAGGANPAGTGATVGSTGGTGAHKNAPSNANDPNDSGGCGCRITDASRTSNALAAALLLVGVWLTRRSRQNAGAAKAPSWRPPHCHRGTHRRIRLGSRPLPCGGEDRTANVCAPVAAGAPRLLNEN